LNHEVGIRAWRDDNGPSVSVSAASFALDASAAVRSRFKSIRQRSPRKVSGRPAPLVSFVIPVRNDASRLACCLRSIRNADYPEDRIEIVVVDNGSRDGSEATARHFGARVVSLPGRRVSELRNLGGYAARGEIVAFVDADHEIAPDWISAAVETLDLPQVAGTGALYHAPANATWVQTVYDAFRERLPGRRPVEWLASGNLAVRRRTFAGAGGFDTSLETCEDVDLCQRLRRTGSRIICDARMKSVHFGDPETLWSLFCAELWRGRDNFRASLRGPLTWRGLPSVAIPALDLAMLVVAFGSLLVAPQHSLTIATLTALVIGGFAALRTVRIITRLGTLTPRLLAQAFAVASVYDLARALAPVSRAGYRVRRRSAER
jgi:GT2 family glycosyltransferase